MGKFRACASGFTLVEFLVVVAVMAILSSFAAQAFSGMINSVRLRSATDTFFSSIILARSEAIKRNARVVLCKSRSGSACDMAGGWEQGWVVFHDVNENAAVDAGESVVLRQQALQARVRFTGNSQVAKYVSYAPNGTTSLISGAFQAGTFTICMQSTLPTDARQIVISSSGRPRTTKTSVAQCP